MAKHSKTKRGKRKVTPVEQADIAVVEALRPVLGSRVAQAIGAIGNIGDQPPLLALSGLTLAAGLLRRDAKLARTGGRMIAAHLLATAVKKVGKDNVDRSRPRGMINDGEYKMKPGKSHDPAYRSFPSGHTAGATALAGAVAREYPNAAPAAYAAAGTIGVLQVPRRAHFPTDIIAGAIVGLAAEWVIDRLLVRSFDAAKEQLDHPAVPVPIGPA